MEMFRTIKHETVQRASDSGEVLFVRRKFERPPLPEGVSPKRPIGFALLPGMAGPCVITEMRSGSRWVDAWELAEPETIHGNLMPYVVEVGLGEKKLSNLDEEFYFPRLPPEVARLTTKKAQAQALAEWVAKFVRNESRELHAKAAAMQRDRLKTQPPRLPHEDAGVDHHENQQHVVLKLLHKEWPSVSAAMAGARTAKTEQERENWERKRFLAYIADFKSLHGKPPDVQESEAAQLWRDDDYIRLMNDALNAPRGRVDKRDWQLALGWTEKGYYLMSEAGLEVAFARDWNYSKPIKGNTLARRARTIGLQFALKRGAPEKHKFNDAALRMRKT